MNNINFYHLKHWSIYSTLSKLLEKAIKEGKQSLVRTGSLTATDALDEYLWSYDLSSFLPHSKLGDQEICSSPIHISNEIDYLNNAQFLFVVSTDNVSIDEILNFKRTFIIFNNDDVDVLKFNRSLWTNLEKRLIERRYWTQENQRWVHKELK